MKKRKQNKALGMFLISIGTIMAICSIPLFIILIGFLGFPFGIAMIIEGVKQYNGTKN